MTTATTPTPSTVTRDIGDSKVPGKKSNGFSFGLSLDLHCCCFLLFKPSSVFRFHPAMLGNRLYHAKSTHTKIGHGTAKGLGYHQKNQANIIRGFPNYTVEGDIRVGGDTDEDGGGKVNAGESLSESTSTSATISTSTSTFQYTFKTTTLTHARTPMQELTNSPVINSPTQHPTSHSDATSISTVSVMVEIQGQLSSTSTLTSQFTSNIPILSEKPPTKPATLLPTAIEPTVPSPSTILGSSLNVGAVVGGSVGCLLGLGLIAGLIAWWVIRRRRQRIAPSAAYKAIYGTESPFPRSPSTQLANSIITKTG